MIHCSPAASAPNVVRIDGNATLTIAPTTNAKLDPSMVAANTPVCRGHPCSRSRIPTLSSHGAGTAMFIA